MKQYFDELIESLNASVSTTDVSINSIVDAFNDAQDDPETMINKSSFDYYIGRYDYQY